LPRKSLEPDSKPCRNQIIRAVDVPRLAVGAGAVVTGERSFGDGQNPLSLKGRSPCLSHIHECEVVRGISIAEGHVERQALVRSCITEGVKLPVLPAWVNTCRKLAEQLVVELPACK
jgi:hypothetical protein